VALVVYLCPAGHSRAIGRSEAICARTTIASADVAHIIGVRTVGYILAIETTRSRGTAHVARIVRFAAKRRAGAVKIAIVFAIAHVA
jgi:hypothetical protein